MEEAPSPDAVVPALVRSFLLGLFILTVARHAWVCDDAYVSFRAADLLVHGEGLSANVDERVQSFTNPLWTLLFSLFYALTGEAFYTALVISIALSAAAAWLVGYRLARSAAHGALALAMLTSSLAFVDYSTSGLENPLSHLLLGAFFWIYLQEDRGPRTFLALGLVTSGLLLTRMDLALVVAPVIVEALWSHRSWRNLEMLLLGGLPFVGWEIFSLLYYGFPFPNTAYAKLGNGIKRAEMMKQGFMYYVSSLDQDPITLLLIGLGLAGAITSRARRTVIAAIGVLLYLVYLIRIGGDFMLGRFLSVPLYVVVTLVARRPELPTGLAGLIPTVAVLALGLTIQFPTLRSDATYPAQRGRSAFDERGVADERAFYSDGGSLLDVTRAPRSVKTSPSLPYVASLEEQPTKAIVVGSLGQPGYYLPRERHVVDIFALADPLLARLPAVAIADWRVGHFPRFLPDGYVETLETGENRIVDDGLRAYYDDLRLVVRGPIFSWERVGAMWRLNTGANDPLIRRTRYRWPHVQVVALSQLAEHPVDRTPRATYVKLEAGPLHGKRILLRLHCRSGYRVAFIRDLHSRPFEEGAGFENGAVRIPACGDQGFVDHTLDVPDTSRRGGYDALRLITIDGDETGAIAGVRLLE